MRVRGVLLPAVAVVAAVGLAAGCSDSDDGSDEGRDNNATVEPSKQQQAPAEEPATEEATEDVEIVRAGVMDHDVWGPGSYVVEYEITNNGQEAADYFVQLEFLDADGDLLGTTGVTADQLGPGKTNAGDTAPLDAEIDNGTLADIRDVRVSEVDRTPSEG
jgi:hypothetical protein